MVRLLPSTRQKGRALSKRTTTTGSQCSEEGHRRQRPSYKAPAHSKGQSLRRGAAGADIRLGTGKAQAHSQLKQILILRPSLNPVRD